MPSNTKMELHDTTTSKLARNKSYFTNDPLNGDNKYTADDICKMAEFWYITYMLGLVDSFSNKWFAFMGKKLCHIIG